MVNRIAKSLIATIDCDFESYSFFLIPLQNIEIIFSFLDARRFSYVNLRLHYITLLTIFFYKILIIRQKILKCLIIDIYYQNIYLLI